MGLSAMRNLLFGNEAEIMREIITFCQHCVLLTAEDKWKSMR